MAEPTPTVVGYGTYAQALGSVAAVVGQLYSATQAAKLGEYNAAIAEQNAQTEAYRLQIDAQQQSRLAVIAQQEQEIVASAAAFKEARFREQFARLQGELVARVGASGIGFEGSPLYVMEENLRQAEMQVLVDRYSAQLQQRALGEEVIQRQYAAQLAQYGVSERLRIGEQQSGLARFAGQAQATSNLLAASGEAVKGSAQFYYGAQRDTAIKAGTYGSGRRGLFGTS